MFRFLRDLLGRRPPGGRTLILLYHRVADAETDPQLLCVAPRRFAEQLEVLRRRCRVLPLAEVCREGVRADGPPTAVVTFDDGYADNLLNAKPILAAADVPATVFVATGKVGGAEEFWWDELERLLLVPGRGAGPLRLPIGGEELSFDLGCDVTPTPEWNVLSPTDPTPRHHAYRVLSSRIRPLHPSEREAALARLRAWANADATGRASHRVMTPEELRALTQGGLVEIGAHTVSHPVLAALAKKAQAEEVRSSKLALEAILGQPVSSFSYPFGSRSDYTPTTRSIVRQAGFARACANVEGLADPGAQRYELPRMIVRDWDADTFERQLLAWLGA